MTNEQEAYVNDMGFVCAWNTIDYLQQSWSRYYWRKSMAFPGTHKASVADVRLLLVRQARAQHVVDPGAELEAVGGGIARRDSAVATG